MSGGEQDDFADRFGGIGRLMGADGLARLRRAHVCVIGVGGVGSWTVEALVRSGIGFLTLVDGDDVCITNTNRQLPALDGTVGRPKVEVLAERAALIHPGCRVTALRQYVTPANLPGLLEERFDYVMDAIDRAETKAEILAACLARGIPVLTTGGAGGRRDATAVRAGDLSDSKGDALLKAVRRTLRRTHGTGTAEGKPFGIRCVYSAEPQVFPWRDGICRATAEPGESLRMDCASGFGAATFVTGAMGFAAAGDVVCRLAGADATAVR